MNNRTNSPGNWALMLVAVIVFGLLMGLRTEFRSEWLRCATAGVAFVVLFTSLNHFRKGKRDTNTQRGTSPLNGGAAKPLGDSGDSGEPPSVGSR